MLELFNITPKRSGWALIKIYCMKAGTRNRKPASKNPDLAESADDKKHLKPDEGTLDLPDVKDIPGQEHVRPMPAGEMADTTISSADEEGAGILDTEEGEDVTQQLDSNVTKDERELLEESESSMGSPDDQSLKQAKVDATDEDGTPLNENVDDLSGSDLDVPGSEDDDDNEEIGEGDEENNPYSLNDDKEDDINTRT
jgi:hypothetical protein